MTTKLEAQINQALRLLPSKPKTYIVRPARPKGGKRRHATLKLKWHPATTRAFYKKPEFTRWNMVPYEVKVVAYASYDGQWFVIYKDHNWNFDGKVHDSEGYVGHHYGPFRTIHAAKVALEANFAHGYVAPEGRPYERIGHHDTPLSPYAQHSMLGHHMSRHSPNGYDIIEECDECGMRWLHHPGDKYPVTMGPRRPGGKARHSGSHEPMLHCPQGHQFPLSQEYHSQYGGYCPECGGSAHSGATKSKCPFCNPVVGRKWHTDMIRHANPHKPAARR